MPEPAGLLENHRAYLTEKKNQFPLIPKALQSEQQGRAGKKLAGWRGCHHLLVRPCIEHILFDFHRNPVRQIPYPPAEAEMGKLRLREMKSRAHDGTQGLK